MGLILPKREVFVRSAPPLIRPRRWLPDVRRRIVPATMAVAFDALTAAVTTVSSASTLTISNLTVGAGANRALAVEVWFASTAFPTITGIAWSGQAMTQVTGTQFASGVDTEAGAIYGLIAPNSGNNSLVISWSSGAVEAHAAAISFTGVDQTSVAVAFPHGTTAGVSGASPSTVTITTITGNMVLAGHSQGLSLWGANNGTLLASDTSGPAFGVLGNYTNGAGTSVTLTAAFTGTGQWHAMGTDILAASGGAVVHQNINEISQAIRRASYW